jgi:pyruvyl transferase EpsO
VNLQQILEPIGISSPDARIMNSLKDKLKEILGSFDTTKRVIYYDYPLHMNIGDLLINLGTEQFLADHNINVWRRYSIFDMPDSIKGMEDDVVILCQGGGNFGDLYPIFQNGRERVLRLYPRNRIVILPQTVHFRSRERFFQSMEQFRTHGNCYIFARDNRSLGFLRQASFTQTSAMPDMAHYLWGKLLPITPRAYEAQPLRFVRRDGEAKSSPLLEGNASTVQSYDWPDTTTWSTRHRAGLTLRAIRFQNGLGLHTQKYWQWHSAQDRAIRDGVRFFSKYRKIYTNRLHVMLLGLLLEREVCAFDNSYGKLSSYRDTWLSGLEGLKWEPEE